MFGRNNYGYIFASIIVKRLLSFQPVECIALTLDFVSLNRTVHGHDIRFPVAALEREFVKDGRRWICLQQEFDEGGANVFIAHLRQL